MAETIYGAERIEALPDGTIGYFSDAGLTNTHAVKRNGIWYQVTERRMQPGDVFTLWNLPAPPYDWRCSRPRWWRVLAGKLGHRLHRGIDDFAFCRDCGVRP